MGGVGLWARQCVERMHVYIFVGKVLDAGRREVNRHDRVFRIRRWKEFGRRGWSRREALLPRLINRNLDFDGAVYDVEEDLTLKLHVGVLFDWMWGPHNVSVVRESTDREVKHVMN